MFQVSSARRPIRNWASVTTPLCLRNGARETREKTRKRMRGVGWEAHVRSRDPTLDAVGTRSCAIRRGMSKRRATAIFDLSLRVGPGPPTRRFHDTARVWAPAESTPTLCFLCYLLFKLFSLLPSVKAVSGNLNHEFSRCFSPFQIAVRLGELG
jgi:hypothetical protein